MRSVSVTLGLEARPPASLSHRGSHLSRPQRASTAQPLAGSVASGAAPTASEIPYEATGDIRALKSIDEALRRGDFSSALRLVNERSHNVGAQHFAPEYDAARALALCGSGQTAAGERAACAFFSAYPRSPPMSARIAAACPVRCGGR